MNSSHDAAQTHVIDLGVGVVNHVCHEYPLNARYSSKNGEGELRERISCEMEVSRSQVCVTVGASTGLASALAQIPEKGQVYLPVPYYTAYPNLIRIFGHTPVLYDPSALDTPEATERLVQSMGSETRAFIINNPSNPTGAVHPLTHLPALSTFFREHKVLVISDEVGSEFLFGGQVLPPIAQLLPDCDVVQVLSFSKSFAVPGLRLGYTIAPDHVTAQIARYHWSLTLGAPVNSQLAMCKILQEEGWTRPNILSREVEQKHDLTNRVLHDYITPAHGGIFAWIRPMSVDGDVFCRLLMAEARILLMPGSLFGSPQHVRMCVAGDISQLRAGLAAIREKLERLTEARGPLRPAIGNNSSQSFHHVVRSAPDGLEAAAPRADG